MSDPARLVYGSWQVKDPTLVRQIALAFDSYKEPRREQLWKEAEKVARKKKILPPHYEFFYEDRLPAGSVIFEFRYYTPSSNREKIQ